MKNWELAIDGNKGPQGTWTGDENNAVTEELKNVLKSLGIDFDENSYTQLAKAIDLFGRNNFYKDVGSQNKVELSRDAISDQFNLLLDGMTLLFKPLHTNSGASTARFHNSQRQPIPILWNNAPLEAGMLNNNFTYLLRYELDKVTKTQRFHLEVVSTGESPTATLTRQNIVSVTEAIAAKFLVKVGMIYVQLPKMPSPQTLYPFANWEDITATYDGAFFRAYKSGTSGYFISDERDGIIFQRDAIKRIQGTINITRYSFASTSGIFTLADDSTNTKDLSVVDGSGKRKKITFDTQQYFSATQTANEFRPYNTAIRIFKCTGIKNDYAFGGSLGKFEEVLKASDYYNKIELDDKLKNYYTATVADGKVNTKLKDYRTKSELDLRYVRIGDKDKNVVTQADFETVKNKANANEVRSNTNTQNISTNKNDVETVKREVNANTGNISSNTTRIVGLERGFVQDETALGDLATQANGKKFYDKITDGGLYKIFFNGAVRTYFVSFVRPNINVTPDLCGVITGSRSTFGYVLCIKSDGKYESTILADKAEVDTNKNDITQLKDKVHGEGNLIDDGSITFPKLNEKLQTSIKKIDGLNADTVIRKDFTILGLQTAEFPSGFNAGDGDTAVKLRSVVQELYKRQVAMFKWQDNLLYAVEGKTETSVLWKDFFYRSFTTAGSDFYIAGVPANPTMRAVFKYVREVTDASDNTKSGQFEVYVGYALPSGTKWYKSDYNVGASDTFTALAAVNDDDLFPFFQKPTALDVHSYGYDPEKRELVKLHFETDDGHKEHEEFCKLEYSESTNSFSNLHTEGHITNVATTEELIDFGAEQKNAVVVNLTQATIFHNAKVTFDILPVATARTNIEFYFLDGADKIIKPYYSLYKFHKYNGSGALGNTASSAFSEASTKGYFSIAEGTSFPVNRSTITLICHITDDGKNLFFTYEGMIIQTSSVSLQIQGYGNYTGNSPFQHTNIKIALVDHSNNLALKNNFSIEGVAEGVNEDQH